MTRSFQEQGRARQAALLARAELFSAGAARRDDEKSRRNGHLLALGHEEENLYPLLRGRGGAVDFFADRRIGWHRTARSGDRKAAAGERRLPTRNLASSQVSCVNFLLPLNGVPDALTAALRSIDSDVVEVVPIEHQGRTSHVEFEWVGEKETLEPLAYLRGAQRTSTDAFVLARIPGGIRAYLIEWKYVEGGEDEDKSAGKMGITRRSRYGALFHQSGLFQIELDEALHEPIYQFVRFALLGYRTRLLRELDVTDFKVVAVCPPGNEAYRRSLPSWAGDFKGTLDDLMRDRVLRDARYFQMTSQRDLMGAIRRAGVPGLEGWVEYHQARYDW